MLLKDLEVEDLKEMDCFTILGVILLFMLSQKDYIKIK